MNKVTIRVTHVITQNVIKVLPSGAGLKSTVVGNLDRRDELSGREIADWFRAKACRGDDESAVQECCEDKGILEGDSLIMETAVWEVR